MPRRFKKKNRWESAAMNMESFDHWYFWLRDLAINAYEWENMPDTVDVRFLELTLFDYGYALFFKDEILEKFLCLTTSVSGNWDVYNIPIERQAFASNDYNYSANIDNSVLIYRDYNHMPLADTTVMYAKRIMEIERTIDTNIKGQKFPILILCNERQRLVMKNLYEKYDGNEPYIFGSDTLNIDGIQVLNTNSPYVADKLSNLKNSYINEYLTLIGYENSYNQKKERMVSDEVGSNYGQVEAARLVGLHARQEACEKINRMFGLNISVRFSSKLPTLVNGGMGTLKSDTMRTLTPQEEEFNV